MHFLALFQLGEVSARPGNRHRLSLQTITFEFNKTPRTQPSPTAIELLYPIFDVVTPVAVRIEGLPTRDHISSMSSGWNLAFTPSSSWRKRALVSP